MQITPTRPPTNSTFYTRAVSRVCYFRKTIGHDHHHARAIRPILLQLTEGIVIPFCRQLSGILIRAIPTFRQWSQWPELNRRPDHYE